MHVISQATATTRTNAKKLQERNVVVVETVSRSGRTILSLNAITHGGVRCRVTETRRTTTTRDTTRPDETRHGHDAAKFGKTLSVSRGPINPRSRGAKDARQLGTNCARTRDKFQLYRGDYSRDNERGDNAGINIRRTSGFRGPSSTICSRSFLSSRGLYLAKFLNRRSGRERVETRRYRKQRGVRVARRGKPLRVVLKVAAGAINSSLVNDTYDARDRAPGVQLFLISAWGI